MRPSLATAHSSSQHSLPSCVFNLAMFLLLPTMLWAHAQQQLATSPVTPESTNQAVLLVTCSPILQGPTSALQWHDIALQWPPRAVQRPMSALQGPPSTLRGGVSALQGQSISLQGDKSALYGDLKLRPVCPSTFRRLRPLCPSAIDFGRPSGSVPALPGASASKPAAPQSGRPQILPSDFNHQFNNTNNATRSSSFDNEHSADNKVNPSANNGPANFDDNVSICTRAGDEPASISPPIKKSARGPKPMYQIAPARTTMNARAMVETYAILHPAPEPPLTTQRQHIQPPQSVPPKQTLKVSAVRETNLRGTHTVLFVLTSSVLLALLSVTSFAKLQTILRETLLTPLAARKTPFPAWFRTFGGTPHSTRKWTCFLQQSQE